MDDDNAANDVCCVFICWPEASLISKAVRIRAIKVDVKWTVLSSAMDMFILTRRYREGMHDNKEILDHSLVPNSPMRTYNAPGETNLCAAMIHNYIIHCLTLLAWHTIKFTKLSWNKLGYIVNMLPSLVQHTKSLPNKYLQRRQTQHSHSLLLATICTMVQVKVHCSGRLTSTEKKWRHTTNHHDGSSTVLGARLCGCHPNNCQHRVEDVAICSACTEATSNSVYSTKLGKP